MPKSVERDRPHEPRAEELAPEFWVVETAASSWVVSGVMARHVERELDARPRLAWVTFVDVSGARVRLRAAGIHAVSQSTAEIRAWRRRFQVERDREGAFDDE